MANLTGKEVFAAFIRDPKVVTCEEAEIKVVRPLIEAMPTVLAEYLSNDATALTLFACKERFLQYSLQQNNLQNAALKLPHALSEMVDKASIATALAQTQTAKKHLRELMNSGSVTDTSMMLSEEVGLIQDLATRYRLGVLTIEDILRRQPGVIIFNV